MLGTWWMLVLADICFLTAAHTRTTYCKQSTLLRQCFLASIASFEYTQLTQRTAASSTWDLHQECDQAAPHSAQSGGLTRLRATKVKRRGNRGAFERTPGHECRLMGEGMSPLRSCVPTHKQHACGTRLMLNLQLENSCLTPKPKQHHGQLLDTRRCSGTLPRNLVIARGIKARSTPGSLTLICLSHLLVPEHTPHHQHQRC